MSHHSLVEYYTTSVYTVAKIFFLDKQLYLLNIRRGVPIITDFFIEFGAVVQIIYSNYRIKGTFIVFRYLFDLLNIIGNFATSYFLLKTCTNVVFKYFFLKFLRGSGMNTQNIVNVFRRISNLFFFITLSLRNSFSRKQITRYSMVVINYEHFLIN